MTHVTWTDVAQAIGAILMPLLVAILAYGLSRTQSRSNELLRVRLEYYKALITDLNRLMCYMTFIGGWRDQSPADILTLKRRLDETFYCASPLFSPELTNAYDRFMGLCFVTFGSWGADARILSSAYRRRQSWIATPNWDSDWDRLFGLEDSTTISVDQLRSYRNGYDELVAMLVRDLDINRARSRYTTDQVSMNAHRPRVVEAIEGLP